MKKVFRILFSSVLVFTLVACGGGNVNKKEVLHYATPDNGPALELQQKIVDDYNASQEKYEVKLDAYGSAFDQKMASAIGAGTAPDIVKMWNFPIYYKNLLPLDSFVNEMEDKDDFYETLYNYATFNKELYGMPVGFSTRAFYADKKKMSDEGIEIKENWTMEDFREIAKATTHDTRKGFYSFYNPDVYAMESFVWTFGSEGWLNEDGTSNVTDPKIAEMLQFFHDMIYEDESVYLGDNNNGAIEQDFASGDYTFAEFGKWLVPSISEANENFAVYPMPGNGEKPGASTVHAAFLSITKDSKNADGAWDFIKYYTSPEVIESLTEIEMPVRQSISEKQNLVTNPLYAAFYEELEVSTEFTSSLLKSEKWGEIGIEINSTLESIFNSKDANISEELKKLDEKIKNLQ